MKIFAFAILFLVHDGRAIVHGSPNTFEELVCQQCTMWCQPIEHSPPQRGERGPPGEIGPPGPRGPKGVVNFTAIEELVVRKVDEALHAFVQDCGQVYHILAKKRVANGGIFDVHYPGIGKVEMYCDTETDGGRWTVIQRRIDGSTDFYRGWNDYVNGFGDKTREFWFGLEKIHQMTKNGDYEIRIDMIKPDGTHQYAKYGSFSVGPASDCYRLSVSGYSGTARNEFPYNNHMCFTTKDADHDTKVEQNCAVERKGAWWYKTCTWVNPNGVFNLLQWNPDHVRSIEMKIRKRE